MTIAKKYFNGVELGAAGLVTPSVSGVFDLPDTEVARAFIGGRSEPSDIFKRRSLVQMQWECVVAGANHADLVSKLHTLRGYLNPELGFCTLEVENRPGQRTHARCLGFPVSIDQLPYQIRVVEFSLGFERYGYWEDDNYTSLNNPTTIHNDGQLPTYPTYTCTVSSGDSGDPNSISFTVAGDSFQYDGAVSSSDVLVVESDIPDVTLNGERDFANTAQTSWYPRLVVGNSVISKGGGATFTLNVTYRRRYL